MPIYEYVCETCHQKFESLRSIHEADAPIPCHFCSSQATRRVISVFSARSDGKMIAGSSGGCSSCSGCSCGACSVR